MEPHQECAYDHVIMYDGHTTEDQILGRFCGSKLPHPIMASDDQMLMVFKSDASVQRKGFFAQHHTGSFYSSYTLIYTFCSRSCYIAQFLTSTYKSIFSLWRSPYGKNNSKEYIFPFSIW